jgi:oxysterol-binding protein-related protein 1/2
VPLTSCFLFKLSFSHSIHSKKKLHFLYGRWTELLKSTDIDSYDEYLRVNPNKFKRSEERSKSPCGESPAHTPRKVLSKLNSLKMSSFRSLSIQDDNHEPDRSPEPDGDVPRSQSIYSIDIPNSITLWEVEPRPQNSGNYFSFTNFAMSLNEIESNMKTPETLCPTDSRLRPDIRKLEEGDIDGAIAEKNRLEEKQRDTRRARKAKKGGDDWQSR